MSKAKITFDNSIRDAEELLAHFDKANTHPPPENAEVLKRAGLIMALTAWETYVEDRVTEGVAARIVSIGTSAFSQFVERKLADELKRFNNPNSEKTRKLFREFLDVDVTPGWLWNNYDSVRAKESLDELISKRGDAVHRSRPAPTGVPAAHLVKREDLQKAINFLKELVNATDKAAGATST
jgi:hypothetical protein